MSGTAAAAGETATRRPQIHRRGRVLTRVMAASAALRQHWIVETRAPVPRGRLRVRAIAMRFDRRLRDGHKRAHFSKVI